MRDKPLDRFRADLDKLEDVDQQIHDEIFRLLVELKRSER